MKKRIAAWASLAVVCAVLLTGCMGWSASSNNRQFKDYAEFQETFGEMFQYPTYLPAGFDFTKGEGTFGAGASYIKQGGFFSQPDPSKGNLSVAAVGCTKEAETKENWVLLGVSMQVYTAASYYDDYAESIEGYIAEKGKGETAALTQDGYDIALREYYDTENLKDPDTESDLPYERCFLDYTFMLADQPYTFNYFIEIYDADTQAAIQAARDAMLKEAVLTFASLEPFKG